MMTVTLSGSTLTLSWQRCPKALHETICARIREIPGWLFDRKTQVWHVPAAAWEQCVELFPYASYDDRIFGLPSRAEVFYRNMIALGIGFEVRGEQVVAVGQGVSPCVAELVASRSPALLPLVRSAVQQATVLGQSARPQGYGLQSATGTENGHFAPSVEDERIWAAIQGGRKAEEEQAKIVEQKRRERRTKKSRPVQGVLL